MNNKFTRVTCLICCMFFLTIGSHTKANTVDFPSPFYKFLVNTSLSTEWQEYSFTDGVRIEYRMKEMNSQDYGREVNMVVFRFTNTTNQVKDCSWIVKIERNNQCYNCDGLENPDEISELHLEPNEVAIGKSSNLITHPQLNIFGNFVKLVPGMTEQTLTAFELIDLTIK